MTCMVRQLQPTEQGIPMELYFFASTTDWIPYEDIQADVFDHILAVIPEFGLQVFQGVSGSDLRHLRIESTNLKDIWSRLNQIRQNSFVSPHNKQTEV